MVGVPGFTDALSAPCAAVTVTSGGHEIVGGVESKTVTVKVQFAFPISDCEIIECVPTAKNEPEAGLFVMAPQLPVGEAAAYVTNAPG
jgi:hypothetical protein